MNDATPIAVSGTLTWNEFEGGFWSIQPENDDPTYVLQGWQPPASAGEPPLTDGTRVRARLRIREAQIGFLMAGTYADVVDVQPA